jgi:hypothetical protein
MSFNKKLHEADLYISSQTATEEDLKIISAFFKNRKRIGLKKRARKKIVKSKSHSA